MPSEKGTSCPPGKNYEVQNNAFWCTAPTYHQDKLNQVRRVTPAQHRI